MTLKNIISKKLKSNSYQIRPTEINWIENYIETCPTFFNDITRNISIIINNNKIELYNIPKIILIIYNIHKDNIIKYDLDFPDNIIVFVKITVDCIFESNIYILSNIDKNTINYMIDTSLEILKINTNDMREEQSCCF